MTGTRAGRAAKQDPKYKPAKGKCRSEKLSRAVLSSSRLSDFEELLGSESPEPLGRGLDLVSCWERLRKTCKSATKPLKGREETVRDAALLFTSIALSEKATAKKTIQPEKKNEKRGEPKFANGLPS